VAAPSPASAIDLPTNAAQSKDAARLLRRKQAKKAAQPAQSTSNAGPEDFQVNPQPATSFSSQPQYFATDEQKEVKLHHRKVAFGVMSLEGCSQSTAAAAVGSKRRQAKVDILLEEVMAELEGELDGELDD